MKNLITLDSLYQKYENAENEWYANKNASIEELRAEHFTENEMKSFAFEDLYEEKLGEIEDGMPGEAFFHAFFRGYK